MSSIANLDEQADFKTCIVNAQQSLLVCAGKTSIHKEQQSARHYVLQEIVRDLKVHIATKAPRAPVFAMPEETKVARMLHADLKHARAEWWNAAHSAEERLKRDQSDFLAKKNHDGEVFDLHSLRHTVRCLAGAAGSKSKGDPDGDASLDDHADDGHLRTPLPRSGIRGDWSTPGGYGPPVAEAATRTADGSAEAPGSRSARRSAQDAHGCADGANGCDNGEAPEALRIAESPEKTGARSDTVRPGTMPCIDTAPLAQLAEQLTLNQ